MDRKNYTVLIMPGLNGKIIRMEVPRKNIYFAISVGVILLATLGVFGATYLRMLVKVSDYNVLRIERETLRNRVLALRSAVEQTNEKLTSIQSLARDVAVTYTFTTHRPPRSPFKKRALAAEFLPGVGSHYDVTLQALSLLKANWHSNSADLFKSLILSESDYLDLSPKPSLWPVRGHVTSHFGQRIDPFLGEGMFHSGVDISAPQRTEVIAPADGLVIHTGPVPGYGNLIKVSHGYGISTRMAHLSKFSVLVGQQVKRGQSLGLVGNTGRSSGPHLHYEVLVNDVPVNPARYLNRFRRRQIARLLVPSS
jgi:murein DD-endopeptidase MepM/ murein hydrolase activator NlpD